MLTTLIREVWTSERFLRVPESDLITTSEDAVSAYVRACQPRGILSGVHAFYVEQAHKMIRSGDLVLDLGCGPGALLSSLAALNKNARFIGVDRSETMVTAGNRLLQQSKVTNVELRIDDMTELSSIASGSIDVVLSSMAMHHLPDSAHLRRCFGAIGRVMADRARLFVADFGRVKSKKSVEYFVRRAVPDHEPVLQHDYRASLRAAFSQKEFGAAIYGRMKSDVSIYSTVFAPVMIILMTPFPKLSPAGPMAPGPVRRRLPWNRQLDYRQLRLCLRLGGMPLQ